MSSFPKHSFEQAYDHAFPPSPPSHSHSHPRTHPQRGFRSGDALGTVSEQSPLITKAPISTAYTNYNNNNNNNNNDNNNGDAVIAHRLHPGMGSYTSNESSSSYVTADYQLDRSLPHYNNVNINYNTDNNVSSQHGKALSSTETLLETGTGGINNNNNNGGGDARSCRSNGSGSGSDMSSDSSSGKYMSIQELTLREFRILLRYSGPVVLTYILQNSMQLASLISLGHLGSI
ncbi:hypothetical protein BGZ58_001330, partial [Dissophora ornata]